MTLDPVGPILHIRRQWIRPVLGIGNLDLGDYLDLDGNTVRVCWRHRHPAGVRVFSHRRDACATAFLLVVLE
jgi:hypothetical protein